MQHIHLTDPGRINPQLCRHQIDRVLHRKDALRRTVAAVRARTRMVAVHRIRHKAERLVLAAVQRDGFMSG